jgi:hypothetical protein
MRVVEFFCGTKSFSNVMRDRGHEVFTLDFDAVHNPDLCCDILDFDIGMLPEKFQKPDVIWASPPCTVFSIAAVYRYWNPDSSPKSFKTYLGLAIAKRTLEVLNEIKPTYFIIENPRGMLRKQRFMGGLRRSTVTYCQYGAECRKPTDLWNNLYGWVPRPMCSNKDSCHQAAPRSTSLGIQWVHAQMDNILKRDAVNRSVVPKELCIEIAEFIEGKNKVEETPLVRFSSTKRT